MIDARTLREAAQNCTPDELYKAISSLSEAEADYILHDWNLWARPDQLEPPGDWQFWFVMAGRGYGKTRTGSEWVRQKAQTNNYVNLIGATSEDARTIMIEGDSGILACCSKQDRPRYIANQNCLKWPNGAISLIFTAVEPERLRGKQHAMLWCFIAGTKIKTANGNINLENIKVGDYVSTRIAERRVTATANRIEKVGRVTFNNGVSLVGTAEHPVLSSCGWTRISDLKIGDKVCVGLSDRVDIWAPTSAKKVIAEKEKTFTSIDGFGKIILEKFQKVFIFIISTITGSIIISKISDLLVILSTQKNIVACKIFLQKNLKKTLFTLVSAAKKSKEKLNAFPLFVKLVNINKQTIKEGKKKFALFAKKNLRQLEEGFAVSVVSTWEDAGSQRVFNITVDGEHEYFANGILTHNCDELGAWRYREAWEQAMFGLRLGSNPRALITTTPRPTPLIRELLKDPLSYVTRGTTYDNKENLAPSFLSNIIKAYEGTRLGRQELNAELLDDNPNALWQRDVIDALRILKPYQLIEFKRIVVAVDPAVTSNEKSDETGIVVCGIDYDDHGYVIDDLSLSASPEQWARVAVNAFIKYEADCLVAETNNGGDLVEAVVRTINKNINFKKIHASRGKSKRAEPMASLYEQGRVHHLGFFPKLEDEMCEFDPSMIGNQKDDRMDAAVWALTELFSNDGIVF